MPTNIQVIGTLLDLNGNPNAGKVTFTLVNYGGFVPTLLNDVVILSPVTWIVQAAEDGTFSINLYGNNKIVPAGTGYQVRITAADDSFVGVNTYTFNSDGVYDLADLIPVYNSLPTPLLEVVGPMGPIGPQGEAGADLTQTVNDILARLKVVEDKLG